MDDGIDPVFFHDFGHALVCAGCGDVHAVETGPFDAGGLTVGEVVDDDDLLTGPMESVNDVGSDVTAATRDENCHNSSNR